MKNFFNSLLKSAQQLWSNPIAKTAIVGALGATGGMYAGGVWIINEYTVMHSIIGALTAVAALNVTNPKLPDAPIELPHKEVEVAQNMSVAKDGSSIVASQTSQDHPLVAGDVFAPVPEPNAAKERLAALLKKPE